MKFVPKSEKQHQEQLLANLRILAVELLDIAQELERLSATITVFRGAENEGLTYISRRRRVLRSHLAAEGLGAEAENYGGSE
jgi:hypothetical protein